MAEVLGGGGGGSGPPGVGSSGVASSWKVTGQRQTTVSNGESYVPAMVISFVTSGGNAGNITVTGADYDAEKVTAAIQKAADKIDYIGALAAGTVDDTGILTAGG